MVFVSNLAHWQVLFVLPCAHIHYELAAQDWISYCLWPILGNNCIPHLIDVSLGHVTVLASEMLLTSFAFKNSWMICHIPSAVCCNSMSWEWVWHAADMQHRCDATDSGQVMSFVAISHWNFQVVHYYTVMLPILKELWTFTS